MLFMYIYMYQYIYCALGFDVNFMDDVGQTLLNWAAAFGSFEMVRSHAHSHTLTCMMYSMYIHVYIQG